MTKAFEAKFKRKPNQFVAQTYDAIYLARTAIEKAGGTDRTKVRDAIAGINNWPGVGGVFNFSPQRHSGLVEGRPGAAELPRRRLPASPTTSDLIQREGVSS